MDKTLPASVKPAVTSTPNVTNPPSSGPTQAIPDTIRSPPGPSMDIPGDSAPRPFTTPPHVSLVSAAAYRSIIQDKDTFQYTLRATAPDEVTG